IADSGFTTSEEVAALYDSLNLVDLKDEIEVNIRLLAQQKLATLDEVTVVPNANLDVDDLDSFEQFISDYVFDEEKMVLKTLNIGDVNLRESFMSSTDLGLIWSQ